MFTEKNRVPLNFWEYLLIVHCVVAGVNLVNRIMDYYESKKG